MPHVCRGFYHGVEAGVKITWHQSGAMRDNKSVILKIDRPQKFKNGWAKDEPDMSVAQITWSKRTREYRVHFLDCIAYTFEPPYSPLKTLAGAERRARKYITLWAIAGYPE